MRAIVRLAAVSAVLAQTAVAFQVPSPLSGGLVRSPGLRGSCRTSMCETGSAAAEVSRRTALLQAIVLLGTPAAAHAKKAAAKKKDDDPPMETISLEDFYAALEDQEVSKVEFDGAKFEKCYVYMVDGRELLVKEGYPVESNVNSSGPQSVIGRIKNEIKAGNPVTWSWRGAAAFKKFAPKKAAPVDKAEGNLSAEVAKREKKEEKKEGGFFGLSLPAPPKSLQKQAAPAAEEEEEEE